MHLDHVCRLMLVQYLAGERCRKGYDVWCVVPVVIPVIECFIVRKHVWKKATTSSSHLWRYATSLSTDWRRIEAWNARYPILSNSFLASTSFHFRFPFLLFSIISLPQSPCLCPFFPSFLFVLVVIVLLSSTSHFAISVLSYRGRIPVHPLRLTVCSRASSGASFEGAAGQTLRHNS